jgi:hypothetical protein
MKMEDYPRLRSHTRTRKKCDEVVTYYYYDRRSEGKRDLALGKDREAAIEKWKELYFGGLDKDGTLQQAFDQWRRDVLPTYTNPETLRDYTRWLPKIERAFGSATWDGVELADLTQYLERRSGKTQANREISLLILIWNWARKKGLTSLPHPAAGMKDWKNKESARAIVVSDEVFEAIYFEADQVLRDYMDVATATAMRPGDCRQAPLPHDSELHWKASKTGKRAMFDITDSQVLPELVERRRAMPQVTHAHLLTTEDGQPVTQEDLRERMTLARTRAAHKAAMANREDLACVIKQIITPDMRKRSSDLAPSLEEASKLLQHSNTELTRKHYRFKPPQLRPVR